MRFFQNQFVKTDEGYASVKVEAAKGKAPRVIGRRAEEVPPYDPMVKGTSQQNLKPCMISDFELGPVLGAGRVPLKCTLSKGCHEFWIAYSFGKVHFARHTETKTPCAVKMLSKAQLLRQDQLIHVKQEKSILEELKHPFMVNLFGAAQDQTHLYLFMEYVVGGEFFTHLRNLVRLTEVTARFYAAEVLLAIEYLHDMNVIYRDLKPENMLLDSQGHIKITDFGFAKHIVNRTYTLCGTPDYLAPEVILNKGHGKPVDWWAFGVLVYEMLAGFPPFYDDDPMETYKKIVAGRLEFPGHFSRSARDLIRKLLQPDLSKRFGNLKGGTNDLKQHPWFHLVDWNKMAKKQVTPPIKPKVNTDDDLTYFANPDVQEDVDVASPDNTLLNLEQQMEFSNVGFEGFHLEI